MASKGSRCQAVGVERPEGVVWLALFWCAAHKGHAVSSEAVTWQHTALCLFVDSRCVRNTADLKGMRQS